MLQPPYIPLIGTSVAFDGLHAFDPCCILASCTCHTLQAVIQMQYTEMSVFSYYWFCVSILRDERSTWKLTGCVVSMQMYLNVVTTAFSDSNHIVANTALDTLNCASVASDGLDAFDACCILASCTCHTLQAVIQTQ